MPKSESASASEPVTVKCAMCGATFGPEVRSDERNRSPEKVIAAPKLSARRSAMRPMSSSRTECNSSSAETKNPRIRMRRLRRAVFNF